MSEFSGLIAAESKHGVAASPFFNTLYCCNIHAFLACKTVIILSNSETIQYYKLSSLLCNNLLSQPEIRQKKKIIDAV